MKYISQLSFVFHALTFLLFASKCVNSFRIDDLSSRQARKDVTRRVQIVASTKHNRKNGETSSIMKRFMVDDGKEDGKEKYRNSVTEVLSNFMQSEDTDKTRDPISSIDFDVPKLGKKVDLETLAAALDYELYNKEWFVTGNVSPRYFADDFQFQDPDVQLTGIEEYAKGVYKLFDQETARAEIISTVVNTTIPNTITCTWRLSGKVSIGFGLEIKPYIVYTDFTVDPESGLIIFQEDRFDIPGWDILFSALFPFLIPIVLAPPAPPVNDRTITMPNI